MNQSIASPVSRFFFRTSLVLQIAIGLACGIALALVALLRVPAQAWSMPPAITVPTI